jgi:hypothetical protein
MSDSNGKPAPPLRTKRPAVLSALDKVLLMLLRVAGLSVKPALLLTAIVLVLLLSACATPSSTPTEPARNPQPPQLSEPLPSESYLNKAQKLIESWQNAVTGM